MKKVFLTLGFIGAVAFANAQISKGTIFVGGSLNFSTSGGEDVTTSGSTEITEEYPSVTDFGISPRVGYYITDNIAVGLGIGYDMTRTAFPKDTSDNTERTISSSIFSLSPFLRYNMPVSDKFGVFVDGRIGLGFGGSTDETTGGSTTVSTKSDIFAMDISVRPGLLYFLRDNLAIEAYYGRLGYETVKNTSEPSSTVKVESTDNSFGLDLSSNSLGFGFMWYFGN